MRGSMHLATSHEAGVANEHIHLERYGIHGTGHFEMLEKNSLQIAQLIADWLELHVDRGVPVARHH